MHETPKQGVGAATDDESAAGSGSVIALLKRIRTLLDPAISAFLGLTDTQLRANPVAVSVNASVAVTNKSIGTLQIGGPESGSLLDLTLKTNAKLDALIALAPKATTSKKTYTTLLHRS